MHTDQTAARSTLGVDSNADFSAIKQAYRDRISKAHPDIAGVGATGAAAELNAAYHVLSRANRSGDLDMSSTSTTTASPVPGDEDQMQRRPTGEHLDVETATDIRRIGDDTLVLSSPPGESFRRLIEAAHGLGEISYIDRSAAILEAVVRLDDDTSASLVISLQRRAHDGSCEAFVTLEALSRAESLDVSGVLTQLAQLIPPALEN